MAEAVGAVEVYKTAILMRCKSIHECGGYPAQPFVTLPYREAFETEYNIHQVYWPRTPEQKSLETV